MNRDKMIAALTRDESCRLQAYDDKTGFTLTKGIVVMGHPTIGIGRALDTNGISQAEAAYLLSNDIDRVARDLDGKVPCYMGLDDVRQRVLVNMAFNLGVAGLLEFRQMLDAVAARNWDAAGKAMEDSRWAVQVGQRAVRLVSMMRSGVDK
jgi:lysozyme